MKRSQAPSQKSLGLSKRFKPLHPQLYKSPSPSAKEKPNKANAVKEEAAPVQQEVENEAVSVEQEVEKEDDEMEVEVETPHQQQEEVKEPTTREPLKELSTSAVNNSSSAVKSSEF